MSSNEATKQYFPFRYRCLIIPVNFQVAGEQADILQGGLEALLREGTDEEKVHASGISISLASTFYPFFLLTTPPTEAIVGLAMVTDTFRTRIEQQPPLR